MSIRTDLALESLEAASLTGFRAGSASGVTQEETELQGFSVTRVRVETEEGARALGKPRGEYATLGLGALIRREEDAFPRAVGALAEVLGGLLRGADGPVLVAGLGNRAITPDAVGPLTVESILATRHLVGEELPYFKDWRPVSAVAPGVLGQTGVETGELVRGLMDTVRPSAVVAVDALASSRLSRLLRTIQVSDTGIVPGAGVGNARFALNRETLGVPVLAVGVPTVVDGATLAHELARQSNAKGCEALDDLAQPVVVTTRDIDREVADVSRVIGYALNKALHPHLSIEDIDQFLS